MTDLNRDEALAVYHGRTLDEVMGAMRAPRRKILYARGELRQRVWGEFCRRAGCETPCMGNNFIVRRRSL